MKIKPVRSRKDFKDFLHLIKVVYRGNPFHRSTDDGIVKLLIQGPTVFHSHASVNSFLILESQKPVGRFSLIFDEKLPTFLQVSFFEALPELPGISDLILEHARKLFPKCKRVVIGLNGHLNYSAGFLLNHFDEPPVFGLPYTPSYYLDYFKDFQQKRMVSFRFPATPFFEYMEKKIDNVDFAGITVRKLDKTRLKQEIEIYTKLNNACFSEHPFWAERSLEEDFELFYPFRRLLREEYFLFAEFKGEPIGFLLWYPDFNELVPANKQLGIKHLLLHRFRNPIRTFRFTQIAVLPQYRISTATLALILKMIPPVKKAGYQFGEGGYIFEDNIKSITMTRRFLERATGSTMEPYRIYALFESKL